MKFKTIGSDPEFFVLDDKGVAYPATPFAKGSKENPSSIGDGFFEQQDNLSFEGNVPPSETKEEFIFNITKLKQYFADKVSKFNYSISNNGVEYFSKRYLMLPEAGDFGCSNVVSSWDSSTSGIIERPTPSLADYKFRVSGFHIHIGYSYSKNIPKHLMDIIIGRLFDLFLTLPCELIHFERERVNTYGAYGIIRSKDYGVECRALSTFFTQPKYLPFVWDQLMKIEKFINNTSEKDLTSLVNRSMMIFSKDRLLMRFQDIFSKFRDKEVLQLFNETKNINNETSSKIILNDFNIIIAEYYKSNSI